MAICPGVILGCFFSFSILFNHRSFEKPIDPFSLGFRWFSRKKDPWKKWKIFPVVIDRIKTPTGENNNNCDHLSMKRRKPRKARTEQSGQSEAKARQSTWHRAAPSHTATHTARNTCTNSKPLQSEPKAATRKRPVPSHSWMAFTAHLQK